MLHSLVRKEGIPALACAVDDVSGPRQYLLKILYSDPQFVVSLEDSFLVEDSRHLFTFRYEGQNLVPGKAALGHVNIPLSKKSLDLIARHGKPQPQTLSLTLIETCSVWYPKSLSNRMSSLTGFNEHLTLAKAKKVLIIFDTKWLGNSRPKLQSAVEGSRQLTGIPVVSEFAHSYQQADWSIFDPAPAAKSRDLTPGVVRSVEDVEAGALPLEGEDHDAPPPYASVSSKRQRDTCPSLKLDTPPPKRLLQDPPYESSPTKHATSASSASATSTPSSTATVPVDIFLETVTSVVEKLLPDIVRKELSDVLSEILTGSSRPPSMSPTPRRTPNRNPTPKAVIRAAVSTAIKARLERLPTTTLDDAFDQFSEFTKSAEVEFEEFCDGTRYDLDTLKEDHIAAFNDDCNAKAEEQLEEFVESLEEAREGTEAYANAIVVKTFNRLDTVFKMSGGDKCLVGAKDQQTKSEQGRRAMSLPL